MNAADFVILVVGSWHIALSILVVFLFGFAFRRPPKIKDVRRLVLRASTSPTTTEVPTDAELLAAAERSRRGVHGVVRFLALPITLYLAFLATAILRHLYPTMEYGASLRALAAGCVAGLGALLIQRVDRRLVLYHLERRNDVAHDSRATG